MSVAQCQPIRSLRFARTAMLVIHGIGQQNPYETLDSFARNLARYLRGPKCRLPVTISPERIEHDDWVEVCVHLDTANAGPGGRPGQIDVHEYYWAPCTQGKISYRETLSWMIKTDLSPIRHLWDNLSLLREKSGTGSRVFLRELWRIILLYLPVSAVLVWLLTWIPKAEKVPDLYTRLTRAFLGPPIPWRAAITFLGSLATLMGVFTGSGLWKRSRRPETGMQSKAEITWLALGAAAMASFAGLAGLTMCLSMSWAAYWEPIWVCATWKLLGAGGAAAILAYFLTNYVGDVAVYVNADAKSKNYAARTEILKGSTLALTRILKAQTVRDGESLPAYDQVILAGHSLGSVIAYDTINELMNQSVAKPDQLEPTKANLQVRPEDLHRLKGLVTFGSPLDKVSYFFRDWVKPEQAIRAQILSYLHSFRKGPSGRKYGCDEFPHYIPPEPPTLTWLNAWSSTDIVSGPLRFFKDVDSKAFRYYLPIVSHLSYWKDQQFYEWIADNLLLG